MIDKLLCIECQKVVAHIKGSIEGQTTWFPVCSECLYNVKGWTKKQIRAEERRLVKVGGKK